MPLGLPLCNPGLARATMLVAPSICPLAVETSAFRGEPEALYAPGMGAKACDPEGKGLGPRLWLDDAGEALKCERTALCTACDEYSCGSAAGCCDASPTGCDAGVAGVDTTVADCACAGASMPAATDGVAVAGAVAGALGADIVSAAESVRDEARDEGTDTEE
jgi:hypothetical protein